ncbi:MAG TPA: hypothetical protein VFM46_06965, partial [Pseudomonadales bacterium]|nr:hypothetical protein [Pseudomonadales bacterium]
WKGLTNCASNTQLGWKLALPVSSAGAEQVIYNPILSFGSFIVNTTIPAVNSPITCNASAASGWTMAVDVSTGGAFQKSFFGDVSKNFVTSNGSVVSGIALNAVGSPSVVTANKSPWLVNQTISGIGAVNAINPPAGSKSHKLTWIQKR